VPHMLNHLALSLECSVCISDNVLLHVKTIKNVFFLRYVLGPAPQQQQQQNRRGSELYSKRQKSTYSTVHICIAVQ
jgi:hypothetical protein